MPAEVKDVGPVLKNGSLEVLESDRRYMDKHESLPKFRLPEQFLYVTNLMICSEGSHAIRSGGEKENADWGGSHAIQSVRLTSYDIAIAHDIPIPLDVDLDVRRLGWRGMWTPRQSRF